MYISNNDIVYAHHYFVSHVLYWSTLKFNLINNKIKRIKG